MFTANLTDNNKLLCLKNGSKYIVRPGTGDLGVINEAAIMNPYFGSGAVSLTSDSIVLDVGANIGDFSVQAARRCQTGRVYAIEPIQENCEQIKRHVNLNNLLNVDLFQLALGGYNGDINIHVNGSMSSTQWGSGESRQVPQLTLPQFMQLANIKTIDLLKLDCEGAEWELLPAAESVISSIRQICMEYHNGKLDADWLDNWLTKHGFTVARTRSPWNGMLWAWRS